MVWPRWPRSDFFIIYLAPVVITILRTRRFGVIAFTFRISLGQYVLFPPQDVRSVNSVTYVTGQVSSQPIHLTINGQAELMSQVMMKRAEGCQVIRLITPAQADGMQMVELKPAIIYAALALGIDMCALPTIAVNN